MSKINLQMYSFMEGEGYDSCSNFEAAAEMGYDGVELFGPDLQCPSQELKKLLSELHLEPVSMHAPKTEMVEQLIPFAQEVGMQFIGIGMECMQDEEAVHRFAEKLNSIGAKCRESGLTLIYHNHTQEFASCGGERIIDVLMKETNPKFVSFELDAGWCAAAGYDPMELVEQYSGRIKLIHIKESSKVIGPQPPMDFEQIPKDENGRPVFTEEMLAKMREEKEINCQAGKGLVDWKALKKVADRHGCQAYIVEREWSYEGTRAECLKVDLDYYRTQI